MWTEFLENQVLPVSLDGPESMVSLGQSDPRERRAFREWDFRALGDLQASLDRREFWDLKGMRVSLGFRGDQDSQESGASTGSKATWVHQVLRVPQESLALQGSGHQACPANQDLKDHLA